MSGRGPVRVAGALVAAGALVVACASQQHPANASIPTEKCTPQCEKEHACDPSLSIKECAFRCEHALGPRAIYERADWVDQVQGCAQRQKCDGDVRREIRSCVSDAYRAMTPSATARAYCQKLVAKDDTCKLRVGAAWDEAHCLTFHKVFNDGILKQLLACTNLACGELDGCRSDVLGDDVVWDDPDRAEASGGGSGGTVTLDGRVESEAGVPVARASVCARDAGGACVTSDAQGVYALTVPAEGDLTVTATAPGFAGRVAGVTTTGGDVHGWLLVLSPEAEVKKRYTSIEAAPDLSSGKVFATTRTLAGSGGGAENVTMTLEPKAAAGPLYFAPDGKPDPSRTATSTWANGVFAGVAPGVAELTLGPAGVTCIPFYGAWLSEKKGVVRAPVLAGFETRVVVQCH